MFFRFETAGGKRAGFGKDIDPSHPFEVPPPFLVILSPPKKARERGAFPFTLFPFVISRIPYLRDALPCLLPSPSFPLPPSRFPRCVAFLSGANPLGSGTSPFPRVTSASCIPPYLFGTWLPLPPSPLSLEVGDCVARLTLLSELSHPYKPGVLGTPRGPSPFATSPFPWGSAVQRVALSWRMGADWLLPKPISERISRAA